MSKNQPASTNSFTLSRSRASSLQKMAVLCHACMRPPHIQAPKHKNADSNSGIKPLMYTSTLLSLCQPSLVDFAMQHCKEHSPAANILALLFFEQQPAAIDSTVLTCSRNARYAPRGQSAPENASDPVSQVHSPHSASTVSSEQHMSGPRKAPPCQQIHDHSCSNAPATKLPPCKLALATWCTGRQS